MVDPLSRAEAGPTATATAAAAEPTLPRRPPARRFETSQTLMGMGDLELSVPPPPAAQEMFGDTFQFGAPSATGAEARPQVRWADPFDLLGSRLRERRPMAQGLGPVAVPARDLTARRGSAASERPMPAILMAFVDEGQRKAYKAGLQTSLRPALLLLMALVGRVGYGMGPIYVDHAVFNLPDEMTRHDKLPPPRAADIDWTSPQVAAGLSATIIGLALGVAAAYMFWRDARTINYRRATCYGTAHLIGVACIAVHRGVFEYQQYYLEDRYAWLAGLPGYVGNGLYFATVPRAFSMCEIVNGNVPLGPGDSREWVEEGIKALSGVGLTLYGVMAGVSNLQPYVRELTIILSACLVTIGYALPNTNYRRANATVARGQQRIADAEARSRRRSSDSATGLPLPVSAGEPTPSHAGYFQLTRRRRSAPEAHGPFGHTPLSPNSPFEAEADSPVFSPPVVVTVPPVP